MSSLGAWDDMSIKDGEDHGEKIFSFKEPIVTSRKDPSSFTSEVGELQSVGQIWLTTCLYN